MITEIKFACLTCFDCKVCFGGSKFTSSAEGRRFNWLIYDSMTSLFASGRFSKSRGLSASVSFLPSPSFTHSIHRPVILCSRTAQKRLLRRPGRNDEHSIRNSSQSYHVYLKIDEQHHGRPFWRQKRKDKMADASVCNDQASEQGSEQTMDMEHSNTPTETRIARLMITKIVNENFKSYAGTQELGPFHKVFCLYCLGTFLTTLT